MISKSETENGFINKNKNILNRKMCIIYRCASV